MSKSTTSTTAAHSRVNAATVEIERLKNEVARIVAVKAATDTANADLERLQQQRTDAQANAMLSGHTVDTSSLDVAIEKARLTANGGREKSAVTDRALSLLNESLVKAEAEHTNATDALTATKVAECARLCNELFEEFGTTVSKLQMLNAQMSGAVRAARTLDPGAFKPESENIDMYRAKSDALLANQTLQALAPTVPMLRVAWLSMDARDAAARAHCADLLTCLDAA